MPPPKQRATRRAPPTQPLAPHRSTGRTPSRTPDVEPIWLLKALALSLAAALICAWLTLCLLFYLGEWQLVLHPTHTIDSTPARTPAGASLPFAQVRFDTSETGQPRLTAWDIPAASGAKYSGFTILYLHDGSGSLSNTIPTLALLHRAGINVFAIDYRGFGASDSIHPTEARMAQDTAAALAYLTVIRGIPATHIVPYGDGLGASLAVSLAHTHPELPAVILSNPDPDPTATALAAHPSRIIPVRLLFRERFEIATPLATLSTPKLLIAGAPASATSPSQVRAQQVLFKRASSPSYSITLQSVNYDDDYESALTRFLDQYLTLIANR